MTVRKTRFFRRSTSSVSAFVIALASLGAGAAHADTLTWTGTNGSTSSWTSNWSSDGDHTHPQAGDLAQLHVGVSSFTYVQVSGSAAVGSLSARPSFGLYRIRSNDDAIASTLTFDNLGSESVVTVSHSADLDFFTGTLQFGTDRGTMNIALANDLRINNDGARVANGQVDFGAKSVLTGGSALDRRTITVEALGSSAITVNVSGGADFVGDWVVDGAKARLNMNADAFGDASNGVTLVDGGTLGLDALGAVSWNRALGGTGSVLAAGGLAFDAAGSLNIDLIGDQDSDLISVTGAVTLGGTLNLAAIGGYTPQVGDSWTVLTATGGIAGAFDTPLPAGFVANVVGNDLVVSFVPEPATVGLFAVGLLALAPRRRMNDLM